MIPSRRVSGKHETVLGPQSHEEFHAITGGFSSAARSENLRQLRLQRDLLAEAVSLLESTIDPATVPFINNRS